MMKKHFFILPILAWTLLGCSNRTSKEQEPVPNAAHQSGAADEDQGSESILLTTEQDDTLVDGGPPFYLTKEDKRRILEEEKLAPFKSFQIVDGTARLPSRWSEQKDKFSGVESADIQDPTNSATFRTGDLIVDRGTTYVEAWEFLDIEDERIKVNFRGFIRGIGDFDETYWVETQQNQALEPTPDGAAHR